MNAQQLILTLGILVTIAVVAASFSHSMKNLEKQQGRGYANIIYGVWVEVLVTLFPFIVYIVVGTFKNDVADVLETPELAVAAAILSGQGILKFLHGAIGSDAAKRNIERAVFLVALGLLLFLLAIVFVVTISLASNKPWFTGVAQLILLSLSIPLYSALAGGGRLLQISPLQAN